MLTKTSYVNNKLDFWYIPLFLFFGIIIQTICFVTHNESVLSLVSGITGLLAVVLCANKRLSMYVFSFAQLFTYVILAYQQRLYGEIVENIFYFVMLVWGIFIWVKDYDVKKYEVKSKQLTTKGNIILGIDVICTILVVWLILSLTDDTQPFMDAITTVPAFVAQILLTFRYREQWIYWLIIDVGSVIMWGIAGDYIMMTQFIFWTINCLYGFYKWTNIT